MYLASSQVFLFQGQNLNTNAQIAILSHADTDLSMLLAAVRELPPEFPVVTGIALQGVANEESMDQVIDAIKTCRIIVMRCLGDPAKIPGMDKLLQTARLRSQHLTILSGARDLNPELAALSTVPLHISHDTEAYFQAGGAPNIAQMLRRLSDGLLFTTFDFEPPVVLPDHGIYHPSMRGETTQKAWQAIRKHQFCVGVVFYRAHWLSGNTDFIDAIVDALDRKGLDTLPVFTSSLRAFDDADKFPVALKLFFEQDNSDNQQLIDVLINTTSFAMGEVNPDGPTLAGWSVDALKRLNIPVLQAVTSVMTQKQWSESTRGLNALDTAMNVVLPEFDGRVMTVAMSFKEQQKMESIDIARYVPVPDRIERLAGICQRFARLRRLPNAQKKVAFVFTNSSGKAAQIGNAVGLDSPASLLLLMAAMKERGYHLGELPLTSDELMHTLIDRCSYDPEHIGQAQVESALARVSTAQYRLWFNELPEELRQGMLKQWGDPADDLYCHQDHFTIAGLQFGNAVAILQPPRGYGMDQNAIYHQPDLVPTHHYYATYRWLRDSWLSDAIVHMGKHGTLEWLPGKAVALSQNCYPDAIMGDLPLFYPFILNDPGEGSQAKRRSHAVVVDHLMPPMTTADTYGPLAEIAQLVDEYYQAEMLDESRLPLLQQQIWQLVQKANLQYDLNTFIEAELEEHRQLAQHQAPAETKNSQLPVNADKSKSKGESSAGEDALPDEFTDMDWLGVSHLIQEIDGYLCELGAAQIRSGLHILGKAPAEELLVDTLLSLVRIPNADAPGLQAQVAEVFDINLRTLVEKPGDRYERRTGSERLEKLGSRQLFSNSDVIQEVDVLCRRLIAELLTKDFEQGSIPQVIKTVIGVVPPSAETGIKSVLSFICATLMPALKATTDEIGNLLHALDGRYVPAGPSGAPTRGMAHILPTGRNFYAVDPHTLPSESAWFVGRQLAEEVVNRYKRETGAFPEAVTISAWGTSAMRTHGDDIAEVLALLGVRPVWQKENRRVTGVELISPEELKRPRVDVTVRISGFFRDAFPSAIDLINKAVALVVSADEPPEVNFLRKHYLEELTAHSSAGVAQQEGERRASYRVFGSKPGTYGAGILPLIQEKNWTNSDDFALAYVNWGGYAYAKGQYGVDMRDQFKRRLGSTEIAIHNQDNREHDIFDSDDYMQFHGGLIATIRSINGRNPKKYFGNSHDPARPQVRDLKEEVQRVYRTRVVNPKWIESIKKHGYKGALELAATVDYIFGYDATSSVMDDWMYEQLAQTYVLDAEMQQFLQESNPWALHNMTERLLEATERGMWKAPSQECLNRLKETLLSSDELLEKRQEQPAGAAK